jgi:hypothetical protein
MLESPEFASWKGKATERRRLLFLTKKSTLTRVYFSLFLAVTGITKTNNRHEDILAQVGGHHSDRFELKTGDEIQGQRYSNVVFCAPPSGFEDYPAAMEDCITNVWAGPSKGGVFVFTSSGGVYVLLELRIFLSHHGL